MLLAATVALALASSAAAQSAEPLKIYAPSADFWWVQNANNTLAWTGTGPDGFNVWLTHPNTTFDDVRIKYNVEQSASITGARLRNMPAPPQCQALPIAIRHLSFAVLSTPLSQLEMWSTRAEPGDGYVLRLTTVRGNETTLATSEPFTIQTFGAAPALLSTTLAAASATADLAAASAPAPAESSASASANASATAQPSSARRLGLSAAAVLAGVCVALLV
ncbi:uncharacterized protein LOC62_05G007529 [Vanrija pseudolonga]|uniref:DUF642 domain-containing protein n=1 Tax=Vanrija pseudolonga TaxID=143232 RepID=A0AAF0YHG8_9TREE|nr:hypothetical protein LOC62_05G007529 [Vanrija pseudolonga]